jgi:hypothetical protein
MKCVFTEFSKQILCAGTMKDYCMIISRTLQPSNPDELTMIETLTDVLGVFGKLEDTRPVKRFDGVNYSSNSSLTHLFYIPYSQAVYEMDVNTLFLRRKAKTNFASAKDRYYKLVGIRNYGEQDEYLILELKETGFSDKLANTI